MTTATETRPLYAVWVDTLERAAARLPNTPMLAKAKVETLAILNARWEQLAFAEQRLPPHILVTDLLRDAIRSLEVWADAGRFERAGIVEPDGAGMEGRHQTLFQSLWVRYTPGEYEQRIAAYLRRLAVNDIVPRGRCVDLGCGHGQFCHALVRAGADTAVGIDYGRHSIRYARSAQHLTPGVSFREGSVYELPWPDNSFDMAVQNGVFHHLDDEQAAYREAHRVLRPGGLLWVYTDGSGGVCHDLWDASRRILRDVPHGFVLDVLDGLNLTTGKRYHLGDGLNADYRHHTWESITELLEGAGFGGFSRLVGGEPTDFDHDRVAADPYGADKFGTGDLRLTARKL